MNDEVKDVIVVSCRECDCENFYIESTGAKYNVKCDECERTIITIPAEKCTCNEGHQDSEGRDCSCICHKDE